VSSVRKYIGARARAWALYITCAGSVTIVAGAGLPLSATLLRLPIVSPDAGA